VRFLESLFLELYPAALGLKLIVVVISVLMSYRYEGSETRCLLRLIPHPSSPITRRGSDSGHNLDADYVKDESRDWKSSSAPAQ
jgi:hypothetical protein